MNTTGTITDGADLADGSGATTQGTPSWRRRPFSLGLAVVSILTFFASGALLASRIAEHYEKNKPKIFYFWGLAGDFAAMPEGELSFVCNGKVVRITDAIETDGSGRVSLKYGDSSIDLDITIPIQANLSSLDTHHSWMRFMLWKEGDAYDREDVLTQWEQTSSIAGNAVVVVRHPPPGENPLTRGEVMRSLWTFDFYELLPEGGFRKSTLRYPESERAYDRRVRAAKRAGDEKPERRKDELKPQTWQYNAAMMTMPPGKAPPAQFNRDALEAGGIAWPLTGTSLVVSLIAAGFAFAPSRVKQAP